MRKSTLKTLLRYTRGRLRGMEEDLEVDLSRIKTDSRQITGGDLFLPLQGDRFDGHDFILEALREGALLSFCSKAYYRAHETALRDWPLFLVEDTGGGLQDMARGIIESSGARVIAVTGSTGKTSTKDFIFSALEGSFVSARTRGNFNNAIGMPLSVLASPAATEVFVLEMGMNHAGEIRELVGIAPPDIAVITNIGASHIEFLGSKENILKAKLEIVDRMGPGGLLLVNGEDPLLKALKKQQWPFRVETFGEGGEADHPLVSVAMNPMKTYDYQLHGLRIRLGVYGRHNVLNSAPGVIIAKGLGVADEGIQSGIEAYQGEKMRLKRQSTGRGLLIINDAYNASVDSYASALTLMEELKERGTALFFGDMFEMGAMALSGHREVGDLISLEKTDLVLTKGEASMAIGQRLLERGFNPKKWIHVATFEEAAEIFNEILEPGDHLLIKGSRGMAMEKVIPLLT